MCGKIMTRWKEQNFIVILVFSVINQLDIFPLRMTLSTTIAASENANLIITQLEQEEECFEEHSVVE